MGLLNISILIISTIIVQFSNVDACFGVDNIRTKRQEPENNITDYELPLSLALKLHELGDFKAFFNEVLVNKDDFLKASTPTETIVIETRVNQYDAPEDENSMCSALPTKRKIAPKTLKSNVIYFPECARVKRCSGCCMSSHLKCTPLKKRSIKLPIYESSVVFPSGPNEEPRMQFLKTILVEVIEHLSCGCRCRTQARHCQKTQQHDPENCKCICDHSVENGEKNCQSQGKVWDERNCYCQCSNYTNCGTGKYFDEDSCSCVVGSNDK